MFELEITMFTDSRIDDSPNAGLTPFVFAMRGREQTNAWAPSGEILRSSEFEG